MMMTIMSKGDGDLLLREAGQFGPGDDMIHILMFCSGLP
jgi:hypothetical protein